MLQAEGVLGKCSMVTENTAPTSGQRWANGVPWEDLHRWMTVLIGPTAPVTLSSTRGLGEPLPAPGPMGHPSHSGEPWVEVPRVHTSHRATPGRSLFHRVTCALRSTQSAPPFPSEGPVSRDEGLAQ